MSEHIPEGATHRWLAATEWNAGFRAEQRKYYKREDGEWWSYNNVLACWCPTRNPDSWFEEEMRQGYFVEIDHQ